LCRALALAGIAGLCGLALLFPLNVGDWRERLLGMRGLTIHSSAVLPLENLSRDPEQEYFADGMTKELIADLSKISALRVISRTYVMHYKGTKKTVSEIVADLAVRPFVAHEIKVGGTHLPYLRFVRRVLQRCQSALQLNVLFGHPPHSFFQAVDMVV
jgi:hypothetical protein